MQDAEAPAGMNLQRVPPAPDETVCLPIHCPLANGAERQGVQAEYPLQLSNVWEAEAIGGGCLPFSAKNRTLP